ncbi:hypothetical protein H0H93_004569 [Arthromyces matolae]|nr:hypothetical protein H0H93_004569 [Arthromyces matolae]
MYKMAKEKPTSDVDENTDDDGFTKDQRYYYSHPEVKVKNRDRQRARRAKEKERRLAERAAANHGPSNTTIAPPLSVVPTESIIQASPAQRTDNLPSRPPKRQRASSITRIDAQSRPIDFIEQRAAVPSVSWDTTNSLIFGREDKRRPDKPGEHSELVNLELLERNVLQWASGWGGVTYWSYGLDSSFQKAVEKRRVNQWRKQMADHAALGRSLLRRIYVDEGRMPREDWKKREMFYKKLELAVMLVKGLTILELKTPLLPHSGLAVKYSYQKDAVEEESAVETDTASIELRGDDGDESDISADTSDGEGWLGTLQKDARRMIGDQLLEIALAVDEGKEDNEEEEADEADGCQDFYASDGDDDA